MIDATNASTVLFVTRAALDKALRLAWDAAEDCFLDPTDADAKARLAALNAAADAAQANYDRVCTAAAIAGVVG